MWSYTFESGVLYNYGVISNWNHDQFVSCYGVLQFVIRLTTPILPVLKAANSNYLITHLP